MGQFRTLSNPPSPATHARSWELALCYRLREEGEESASEREGEEEPERTSARGVQSERPVGSA